jgi:hypothetical protein
MHVREMQLSDYAAVQKVRQENGLTVLSLEEWNHLNRDNPFVSPEDPVPIGWILEDDREGVVGIYGNFPGRYGWRSQELRAGISHSWAVNRGHRKGSLLLVARYLGQKNVHLLINTSANVEAGRVFETLKALRVPQPDFHWILVWIFRYSAFVESVLRYKKVRGAGYLKPFLAAGLKGMDRLARRNRWKAFSGRVRRIDEFDERFDGFWKQLCASSRQLMAVRHRRALEWHFHLGQREGRIAIFIYETAGRMQGYLILRREEDPALALCRQRVVDLQVLAPGEEALQELFAAAADFARQSGAQILEVVGLSALKRRSLEALAPHRRRMTTWPFWYCAVQPVTGADFRNPEVWDPTLYDGDSSVWR